MKLRDNLTPLRDAVSGYMSDKRFKHTLGVENMAVELSALLLPEKEHELRCAAILHDVAKEISVEEQLSLIEALNFKERDLCAESPSCFHAFAAPMLIKRDFPEYATEDILSATFKHTTGYTEMSVFDKIIFISDYAEEGRTYPPCIKLRHTLLQGLREAETAKDRERVLNRAIVSAMDNTLFSLQARGAKVSELTVLAKNAISALI